MYSKISFELIHIYSPLASASVHMYFENLYTISAI